MKVAVVYESLFGNTRLVAEAIGDGIRTADPAADVRVTRTGATKLSDVEDACLLVVGGPTHMMRMSSPRRPGSAPWQRPLIPVSSPGWRAAQLVQ
jgi:flavorubredoxin